MYLIDKNKTFVTLPAVASLPVSKRNKMYKNKTKCSKTVIFAKCPP